ncbi:uncharacterized protein LOC110925350 [Helianthus annuus]|uniref:uncharacterized protein LOC110925350 n=1 Tax=Helianthus annuus TaxID=4232 RepID=UPI000B8F4866|nr:uncharacterized protein LOC110925350 [Helianthus annuus]
MITKYINGLPPAMRDSNEAAQLDTIEEVYRLASICKSSHPAVKWQQEQEKESQGSGCNAIVPTANPAAKPAPATAADNPAVPEAKKQYTGPYPKCATCNFHNPTASACRLCTNCNRSGHTTPYCRQANAAQPAQQAPAQAVQAALPAPLQNPKPVNAVRACFQCGDTIHLRNRCPQLNQDQQAAAHGRAFNLNANQARNNNDVVNGMFLVNNLYASILFDTGADKSFVSVEFESLINCTRSKLPKSFSVEVANGKSILVNSINHAEIVCHDKLVCLPLPCGDVLNVYGDRPSKGLRLMSCTHASRYLRKQNFAFLAHVVQQKGKGKNISDVPVVCDFTDVFPEDLPGLPPPRSVDFCLDLVPGATPVAKAPYRLAPSEMQELASEL